VRTARPILTPGRTGQPTAAPYVNVRACIADASNIVETRFMTYWIIGVHTDSSGGAFISVDTFFFLSGFLAMLSQLEKYSLGEGTRQSPCKYWAMAMLYRFLRLTPMYLLRMRMCLFIIGMQIVSCFGILDCCECFADQPSDFVGAGTCSL
jgi:hypothetical protein